tara:strand:+ start:414 stop:758 length:345 start_codon:yes stop_codon:yes gene_type:complete
MDIIKKINKLCKPAYVYLVISVLSIVIMIIENIGNTSSFKFGNYEQNVSHTSLVFIAQILYAVFWTFVLDSICYSGYKNISWIIVLLPFILFFLIITLFFVDNIANDFKNLIHN